MVFNILSIYNAIIAKKLRFETSWMRPFFFLFTTGDKLAFSTVRDFHFLVSLWKGKTREKKSNAFRNGNFSFLFPSTWRLISTTMRLAKLIIFQFVRGVILHIKKRGLKERAS